ncbi:uncharacterized protein LOC127281087 [Leptopilina boulardi]|uniref:uncharacterized protein LOC127281087 n=1 Tax=Leptopilina boulardi TaxID=63433 RepID=UPI0021F5CFBE|nr:uncharacterized protein LOC127281087 [Leptopilina boulardi]
MNCRTMRALVFFLGTLTIFYFGVAAERFSIPAELLNQYLNMSKNELYQKCEERNMHCRTVIGLETLEVIEQKNGEKFIELLVNRSREDPPLNEKLWQKAMDRHCHRDIVLQTMLDIGFEYIFQCVPEVIANNKQGLESLRREYLPIYCDRIERIAKQKITRWEH